MCMWLAHPGFVGNGFDGLYSNIALLTSSNKCVKVFDIVGILHRDVVVRHQYRIEVEAFKATPVGSGNLQTVSSDANSSYQALLLRLDSRFDHTTRAKGRIPLDGVYEVMELPQVYIVNMHAFQRTVQLLFCLFRPPLICLSSEIEV